MGLAGAKQNTKIGKDPRNTHWSNDTSRFGHKHLQELGWSQGKGLGFNQHGSTTHIKVTPKRDNTGLGAKKRNPFGKKDDADDDFVQGLDVFQKILGRLNGKDEQKMEKIMANQRKFAMEQSSKFGMMFVYGGLLKGTIDEEGNIHKEGIEVKTVHGFDERNKESSSSESESESEEEKDSKKAEKKSKKRKAEADEEDEDKKSKKKSKKRKSDNGDDKSSSKKSKKEKKEKKEKKDKKDKKDKKEKRSKKEKKDKDSESEQSSGSSTPLSATGSAAPAALKGIHATRSRWIKSKRAATMDSKSLNEIFMVSM